MNDSDMQPDLISANSAAHEPDPTDVAEAEEEFVREVDRQLGRVYSRSGLAVIAAIALFAGLSVTLFGPETLKMARLWIGLVLVFLLSLFVVRILVVRRALDLLAKIQTYCLANDLQINALRAEHTKNGAYKFFESVFEVAERRKIALESAKKELPNPDAELAIHPEIEPSDKKETRS